MNLNDRKALKNLSAEFRKDVFGEQADPYCLVPDNDVLNELDFGLMRARDELIVAERIFVWLTSAIIVQRQESLENLVRIGLRNGIAGRSIIELVVQIALYSGFEIVKSTTDLIVRVCKEEGAEIDDEALEYLDIDEIRESEQSLRESLHGARHTKGYAGPDVYFAKKIYDFGALFGYGVIWRRPGLTIRQRMICALASMTTIGGVDESLRKFALSALDVGLTIDEIAEVAIRTAPISGLWRANGALMVLEDVFPGGKHSAE